MVNHCRWLCKISLGSLPLDSVASAVSSFQLRPVFAAVSSRVPPSNTMSCFVGFGDKSRGSFKKLIPNLRLCAFRFCPKGAVERLGGSIALKTPILKLKCLFACKPPAAIGSESTQVACASCAKTQLAGLRHRWSKGVVSICPIPVDKSFFGAADKLKMKFC